MAAAICQFIRTNDKKAYVHLTDSQLLAHIFEALACNQIVLRVANGDVTGVATFVFRHNQAAIFLVGLVGDKAFARAVREVWRGKFPFYRLFYCRDGREFERHLVLSSLRN